MLPVGVEACHRIDDDGIGSLRVDHVVNLRMLHHRHQLAEARPQCIDTQLVDGEVLRVGGPARVVQQLVADGDGARLERRVAMWLARGKTLVGDVIGREEKVSLVVSVDLLGRHEVLVHEIAHERAIAEHTDCRHLLGDIGDSRGVGVLC